jgi:hypothetical protein
MYFTDKKQTYNRNEEDFNDATKDNREERAQ